MNNRENYFLKTFLNSLKKKYPTIKEYILVPQYHNYNKKYTYFNIINDINMLVSKNELFSDFPELIKFDKFIVPYPPTKNEEVKLSCFINIDYFYHREKWENKEEEENYNISDYSYANDTIYDVISNVITESIINKYSNISFKKLNNIMI